MIRLFCGYDDREAIGFAVFAHSVIARASRPVSITPLASMGLPQGSNAFTLSRFLVPYLMGFQGHTVFVDGSDMLMQSDIAELDALFDPRYAVQVVKHPDYQTRNPRKYIGTSMECDNRNYSRKNWASAMLINCEHRAWKIISKETLSDQSALPWLQFAFIPDEEVDELPAAWNALADEGHDLTGANLLHWTAGIPAFDHYHDAPGSSLWHSERAAMEHVA